MDEKALAFFGALMFGALTLFAIKGVDELAAAIRRAVVTGHVIAVREALVWLLVVSFWGSIAYMLATRVWVLEARPGMFRVGQYVWQSSDGGVLEIARDSREVVSSAIEEWGAEVGYQRISMLVVRVVQDGKSPRTIWTFHGRQKARMETWLHYMAEVAGVRLVKTGGVIARAKR